MGRLMLVLFLVVAPMALIYHVEAIQKVSTTVISELFVEFERSRDSAVVRALASHQCNLGSNPRLDVICLLSLLLVLVLAPRAFSSGAPVFLSTQTPNSKFQFHLESVPS